MTDNAPSVPPVVALVIVEKSSDPLDAALDALAEQNVGALRVLVLDATDDGGVAEALEGRRPDLVVRRANGRAFTTVANEGSRLVAGSGFLCFLAASMALEPGALRALIDEAFRSNAGAVGPKFVDVAQPGRIEAVGFGLDKFAETWLPAEPGELDQEQHDAIVDRFVLPARGLVIRSDLFAAIGGFDETLTEYVASADLCWRAQASGARVLVVPDGRARIEADTLPGIRAVDHRRDASERLQLMFSNYSVPHLLRVIPQAIIVTIASVIANLVTLRPARAAARLAAWPAALGRLGRIRNRRASLAMLRKVPDADIRRLQQRGSAQLGTFLKGRRGKRRLAAARGATSQTWFDDLRARLSWSGVAAWFGVVVFLLIGSRTLVTNRVPAMAGLPGFPTGTRSSIEFFFSGWRPNGLGHPGPAPTIFALLGIAGVASLGNLGLVRLLATAGLFLLGYLGIWRAARPLAYAPGRLAALLVYALVPLAPNAFAGGHWGGLAAYAAAPWTIAWLARLSGVSPWRPVDDTDNDLTDAATDSPDDSGNDPDDWWRISARIVIVTAIAAAIAPAWMVAVVAAALVFTIAAVLGRRMRSARQVLATAIAIPVLTMVLHLPWALATSGFWTGFRGERGDRTPAALVDLLRFNTGPFGGGRLGLIVPVVGLVGLTYALRWRLRSAVTLVAVGGMAFALAWGSERRSIRFVGLETEVLLAIALATLALSVAVGADAFRSDVLGTQLSWRQPLGFLAAFALVVSLVTGVGAAADGSWKARRPRAAETLERVIDLREGLDQFRVLWVGDPLALPAAGWTVVPGVSAALTTGSDPTIEDRWPAMAGRAEQTVSDGLVLAADGSSVHLGVVLAPAAVRFVVVPFVRSDGTEAMVPSGFARVFDNQLDLRRINTGDDAVAIYENQSWVPIRAQLSAAAIDASTRQGADELSRSDVSGSKAVLDATSATKWDGPVGTGDVFVSALNDDGWELRVDGEAVEKRPAFGWAMAFAAPTNADAELRYRTPLVNRLPVLVQLLAWLAVGLVAVRGLRGFSFLSRSASPAAVAVPGAAVVPIAMTFAPSDEAEADMGDVEHLDDEEDVESNLDPDDLDPDDLDSLVVMSSDDDLYGDQAVSAAEDTDDFGGVEELTWLTVSDDEDDGRAEGER